MHWPPQLNSWQLLKQYAQKREILNPLNWYLWTGENATLYAILRVEYVSDISKIVGKNNNGIHHGFISEQA